MQYPLSLPGFENRGLFVETGGFWSGAKIIIDGEPAPKGPKRGQFLLRRLDGTEIIAQLRVNNFLDPIPQVVIDGENILIAEPLKWYQWVWGGLPFALAIIGGALGGLLGGIALVINGRVFRSDLKNPVKYLLTGIISIATVIAFFVSAVLLNLTIRGFTPEVAQEFKSQEGGFSIMTPYALKETTQTVDTQIGKIEVHFFSADQSGESFVVVYSDYPSEVVKASDPEKMLDGSRDGAIGNVKGELVSETHISLNEYPGRDLTIRAQDENGQDLFMRGRIFLVENRLYQIMVIVTKGNESNSEINDFLQSFKLLSK
jgi:hypothetical protein